MHPTRYIVLGGGGHASVVIDALVLAEHGLPEGVLDIDATRWGTSFDGVPILGDDSLMPELRARGVTHFAIGLGGTRNNSPRQRLFEKAVSEGLTPLSVQHPRAYIARSATIDVSAQILCHAVINSHAVVGANVIVNTGAVVEHDCQVLAHAHLAPGARIASGVTIGEHAHIGIGATVIQQITIGTGAVVGAGACVVHDVADHAVVIGVPARGHGERT